MDPVVIVGGGPVGLTLSLGLARYGVSALVLEARESPTPRDESRAITWMPKGLELLDWLELRESFERLGVRRVAHEFWVDERRLLSMPFDEVRSPHPYTLQLPQHISLISSALRLYSTRSVQAPLAARAINCVTLVGEMSPKALSRSWSNRSCLNLSLKSKSGGKRHGRDQVETTQPLSRLIYPLEYAADVRQIFISHLDDRDRIGLQYAETTIERLRVLFDQFSAKLEGVRSPDIAHANVTPVVRLPVGEFFFLKIETDAAVIGIVGGKPLKRDVERRYALLAVEYRRTVANEQASLPHGRGRWFKTSIAHPESIVLQVKL